uniref:NADH-ubiquinone oxidoreductase chain 3 n=1 Tax=Camaenella platyodon TaxID=2566149 RepID=A0A4D6SXB5_9EUPU|nr:NADH dehydrogenase subunit 3 [Camaenella platyodon]
MIVTMMISFILCGMLLLIYFFVTSFPSKSKHTMSAFECGFEPLTKMRRPFSIRYFILLILFLVFDVEVVLFLPCVKIMIIGGHMNCLINMYFFLVILIIGLLYEWRNNMLDWVN